MSKLKLMKYEGILEEYYETGMEHLGFIFHDDRGNHEGPKWDNPDEIMMYRSLEWTLWFNKLCQHKIIIFDKDDNVLYKGPLTRDKEKIAKANYAYSFLPKEIDMMDWIKYCRDECRAELYTNEVPIAIKNMFGEQMPFEVGDRVKDDLTSWDHKTFITHLTYTLRDDGSPGTVGYWVDNDYLEGARHPWELTAVSRADILKELHEVTKQENDEE